MKNDVEEGRDEAQVAKSRNTSAWTRTADVRARVAALPRTGELADKAFFDDLSGQGDDFSRTDLA